MILLYILPLIVNLFFFFGLCCIDTSKKGKWMHILMILFMFIPGLNIFLCGLLIWMIADVGINSSGFTHCKKFWIWLLGE